MPKEDLKQILKSHGLRITDCRLDVIRTFLSEEKTLSQTDLERRLAQYDRVTVYRTLNTFLESGVLHRIPNEVGTATFGLCHETCSPDGHDHNHVHFRCNVCGQTECLSNRAVPRISVPDGYQVAGVNLIVDGICLECS